MESRDSRRGARFGPLLVFIAFNLIGCCARAAGPTAAFDIPAGDAAETVWQFNHQAGVDIVYVSDALVGVRTHAVSGRFEASKALEIMLEGTVLTFRFRHEHEVVITRLTPSATTADAEISPTVTSPLIVASTPPSVPSEMVVTGSYIRGVLDVMSPLQILTKQDMKRTAYATVQDAIQTLPINSGAVQGEDFAGTGNFGRGSAISLRGLGAGATLVLVNGRRQPQAGMQADFVDVSNIPWSAVDRIEVLPDGSSALYGSDAIAGVVNVVMRDNLEGAESQMRFGTAPDGAAETVAAQLFGHRWETGKWLFDYQYTKRTALAAADRAYAANSDKRPFGGRDFRSYRSNPGNILDPRTFLPAFAIPSGQDGTSLTAADLIPGTINLQNKFETAQLLPGKEINSIYLTGSQKLSERLEVFGEGRYSRRDIESRAPPDEKVLIVPANNPFFVDPFGGLPFVIVAYGFLDDLGPVMGQGEVRSRTTTVGANVDIANAWRATLSTSYGKETLRWVARNFVDPFGTILNSALADPNPATAFNPFGDGSHNNPATLEAVRMVQRSRAASQIDTVHFSMDGPLFSLPAGIVKLGFGGERRRENLARRFIGREIREISQSYGREISAAFAEFSVPLIGKQENPLAIPRLELSVAGRYERYSDFGSTFNPKIGLRWAPSHSLKFKTSWSTSFKAPKLIDLYDTSQNGTGPIVMADPLSPIGQSIVLFHQGNNPDLFEETATSWTASFDFTPETIPGLAASLTGYVIEHRDQVIQPGGLSVLQILFHEDQWADVITRNPSRSQIVALCASSDLFGDRSQCESAPVAAIVDTRLSNLASTQTKGFDVKLSYSFATNAGYFGFGLGGSYISSLKQAFTRTSPFIDIADTAGNPLTRKLRGRVEWNQRGEHQPGLGMNIAINHTGGYRDDESPVLQTIQAWTTLDLRLSYLTSNAGSHWDGVELGLNATNILDTRPPFLDREYGYDVVNAEPTGRVVSFYVQKNWGRRQ